MNHIVVAIHIEAPIERVWADVTDLASHVDWMADAESIEFLTVQTEGAGTRMRVATRVGPLRTSDIMEVTAWEAPSTIGVDHQGLVTGSGAFTLTRAGDGTRFTWSETLSFPWWLGGPVTAWLAKPVLSWIWRRNLRGLKGRIEGP